MRAISKLKGTRFEVCIYHFGLQRLFLFVNGAQMSTGAANFMSGGLGAFIFWTMAIPADNIKRCGLDPPPHHQYLLFTPREEALERRFNEELPFNVSETEKYILGTSIPDAL